MERIRIGNDIRLAVDLRQYLGNNNLKERDVYNPANEEFENLDSNPFVNKVRELYYPNQYTGQQEIIDFRPSGNPVSIRSVKAIIINTSKEKQINDDLRKKTRFISRFPIEPYVRAFDATPYNLCVSGYPTWRAYPHRYCVHPYHGFGVYPEWDGIYHKLPIINNTEYVAKVSATKLQNVVEVHFPAVDQLYTGTYKLVIVAKLYCPGFNQENLKTVTVDIPDVFELVGTSEEGIDTGIGITVGNVQDVYPNDTQQSSDGIDLYITRGSFANNNIQLDRSDGRSIDINTSSATGWYEE